MAGVKAMVVELDVKRPYSEQRTDADIAKAAEHALKWSANIPADTIKIQVEKGWITLNGEVDWAFQAKAAERAVRHIRGVVGVSNLVSVKRRVMSGSVKEKIEAALKRQAEREAHHITVRIEGSQAILSGKVHTWIERSIVKNAASSAPGVTEVMDQLSVDPFL